ncbi:hypothetical protein A2U01_0088525, partial [Trifolium medium]|nr:hypothetical protein [Trifolium medium]
DCPRAPRQHQKKTEETGLRCVLRQHQLRAAQTPEGYTALSTKHCASRQSKLRAAQMA